MKEAAIRNDDASPLTGLLGRLVVDSECAVFLCETDGSLAARNEKSAVLWPNPNAVVRAVAPAIKAVLHTGQSQTFTRNFETVHGRMDFRGRVFMVHADPDDIQGVAAVLEELPEQIDRPQGGAEARLSDFARASSDWFWETDEEGRLTFLSQRYTALTGRPAILLMGQPLLGPAGVRDAAGGDMDRLQSMMAGRRSFRDLEIHLETMNGETMPTLLSGVPVFDRQEGRFLGFRGSGRDMTAFKRKTDEALRAKADLEETLFELKRRNMELDVASSRAEASLRAKNEFLASMSHELRTPLNAIIGFSEAMDMAAFGPLNAKYQDYVSDILGAGHHLLNLINDVLQVSLIEGNKIDLSEEDVSVAATVDRGQTMLAVRAEQNRIDLSAATYDGPARVRGDGRRILQILVNLLTNAVKFTPKDGSVGIEVAETDDQIGISVWDTGPGVPDEQREAIFDRFHKGDGSVYAAAHEGTGLGLSISRDLARAMGGDLQLTDTSPEGSRFTLWLPSAD